MKTWLITGCSSGMGAGIAKAVLAKGDQAVVTARNADKVKEICAQYPDTSLGVALDVCSQESIDAAFDAAVARFGHIDVLVNNAGHGYRSSVEEGDKYAVYELFETNTFGPVELIKKVLPGMRERKSGAIINITSIAAVRSAVGSGYYAAAKAALEYISEGLAKEVNPLGIKVMIVEPGAFRTSFYKESNLKSGEHKISDYADTAWTRDPKLGSHKTNQLGDPDRIGEVLMELLDREDTPQRYVMGSDAYATVTTTLKKRLDEVKKFKEYSSRTDFEDGEGTSLNL